VSLVVALSSGARRRILAGAALLGAAVLAAGAFAPIGGKASSHREAPLISGDPQVDNTDVWAFVHPDAPNKVTLMSSWIPFEEPAGGPNFYPFSNRANYDIKIDNDHDAKPDIIYRWKFRDHYRNPNTFLYNTGVVETLNDPDLNFVQRYDLLRVVPGGDTKVLVDNARVVPSNVGEASMPDYEALFEAGVDTFGANDGSLAWAGQSDDPFFLDLRVFDLIYGADASFPESGEDTLAGFNVNTVAIEVHKSVLARDGDPDAHPIIGVWSTTSRRSTRVQTDGGDLRDKGDFVQVSRLGSPLVNELVIPVEDKDKWNASRPADDGQFLEFVQDPILPRVINALYGLDVPDSDSEEGGIQRADLISVFLTGVEGLNMPKKVTPSEQLRLNMSVPPCESDCSPLGVIDGDNAGFPNGRRLEDDVVDIALQVVEGELLGNANDLGDGVDANDVSFRDEFPYVALPHSGSDAEPHTR
jgi:hypothetical protein